MRKSNFDFKTFMLHHVEKIIEIEALHNIKRAAFLQHRNKEGCRRMGQWRRHEHADFLGEFPLGHLNLCHVGADPVGAHDALGFTGGAAGEVNR